MRHNDTKEMEKQKLKKPHTNGKMKKKNAVDERETKRKPTPHTASYWNNTQMTTPKQKKMKTTHKVENERVEDPSHLFVCEGM